MSQLDTFNRIISSLHQAMPDDAHWPAASALIDEACDMTGNELVIAEGRSVREIAASEGFQEGYVRWLIKQVYRKQGVSGQVALVRVVLAADSLPRR